LATWNETQLIAVNRNRPAVQLQVLVYGFLWEREFVTGNEIPRIVAHRCITAESIDVS
jgi:hypothetical protein